MTTRHKLAGAVILAAATATSAHALAAEDPAAPRVLHLSQAFDAGRGGYVDLGRKGIGPGDLFYGTAAPLLDVDNGRRVGTQEGIETLISGAHDGTVAMAGAIRLAGGRIEFAGTVRHSDPGTPLAVVGGTGAYAGARGEMTEREDRANKRTLITLTLLP
jgi:hypothetical protein